MFRSAKDIRPIADFGCFFQGNLQSGNEISLTVGILCLTEINSNGSAVPADLVGNNGFMSCFQMFDRIHDGYSKAHGRGFQFTPGHVCISCADVLYYILR